MGVLESEVLATPPLKVGWSRLGRAPVTFLVTLLAMLLFATAFAVGYAVMHEGRILPGVSVAGISVSGLDRGAAEAALRRALPNLGSGHLTVRVGDRSQDVSYAEIGRDYDMRQMVEQALAVGRIDAPADRISQQLRTLVDGVSIPAALAFNTHTLAQRVAEIAARAEAEPVSAAVARGEGEYAVSPAVDGWSVDERALIQSALTAVDNLSPADSLIAIQPKAVPATVSTAQAQAAVDLIRRVVAAPLVLNAADQTMAIQPLTLSGWAHLDVTQPGSWQMTIERGPIAQYVDQFKTAVDVPATNAEYTFEARHLTVVPSAEGRAIDATAAVDSIVTALEARAATGSSAVVGLSVLPVAPELDTAGAQALVGRVQRLGRWTTKFIPSAFNAFGQNIRRPAQLINGTVVGPGETFDFITAAEPFTKRNGYEDGAAIRNGHSVLEGILGGGLCSASTTLFNAALRAGFQIDARHNHAYYIDRYPVGLDATIWEYGGSRKTMAFTNDTGYPILIRGINSNGRVTFEIWGVDDGRTVSFSRPRVENIKEATTNVRYTNSLEPGKAERVEFAFDGFDAWVTRTVHAANGTVIHEDTFYSDYIKVDGLYDLGRLPTDPRAGTIVPLSSLRD